MVLVEFENAEERCTEVHSLGAATLKPLSPGNLCSEVRVERTASRQEALSVCAGVYERRRLEK